MVTLRHSKNSHIISLFWCLLAIFGCSDTKTPEQRLIEACSNGKYEVMIQLFKEGIDKDVQVNGTTCLMAAAGKGHIKIVEKLLALKVNTELVDSEGNSAIDYATYYKFPQIAEMITTQQEDDRRAMEQRQENELFARLSVQDRQQIFLEITQIWKDGGEGKAALVAKYNISESHLKDIEMEGLSNNWPTADPTPIPTPSPKPSVSPPAKPTPQADALTMIATVFQGGYSKSHIKAKLDQMMMLYREPITEEYYQRVGSVLVSLRKNSGVPEMTILQCVIEAHAPGVEVKFTEAAALCATILGNQ